MYNKNSLIDLQENIKLATEINGPLIKKNIHGKRLYVPQHWKTIKKCDLIRDKEKYPSGSNWNRYNLASLNIVAAKCQREDIIPISFFLEELTNHKKINEMIHFSINKQNIKNKSWRKFGIDNESVQTLFIELEKIYNPENKASIEITSEDETYTDAYVSSFFKALGFNTLNLPNYNIWPRGTFTSTICGLKCETTVDFRIERTRNDREIVFIFEESKRLKPDHTRTPDEIFGQICCHIISIASSYIAISGKDQEIFGIGVQHDRWRFYHAFVPYAYIFEIGSPSSSLPDDIYLIVKYSEEFNIGDPLERKFIIENIFSIIKYEESGNSLISNI